MELLKSMVELELLLTSQVSPDLDLKLDIALDLDINNHNHL